MTSRIATVVGSLLLAIPIGNGVASAQQVALSVGLTNNTFESMGVNVDGAFRIHRLVSLIGEMCRVTGNDGAGMSWTDTTMAAGLRFSSSRRTRIVPFGQLVLGGWHTNELTKPAANHIEHRRVETLNMVQAGGGVDVMLTRRAGVRIAGDIQHMQADPTGQYYGVKTTISSVIRLGKL